MAEDDKKETLNILIKVMKEVGAKFSFSEDKEKETIGRKIEENLVIKKQ